MTAYTIKKLDNRFTLHRVAGFQTMIEWPLCERLYSVDSLYQSYNKFESTVRKTLGSDKHYYKYANPNGTWHSDCLRMSDGRWRHRIFFKEHKHLTLVLMS
jgi:hypothetical protein